MRLYGGELLQAVAGRILERYMREGGATGVLRVDEETDPSRLGGVDLVYIRSGRTVRAKIKADPYFGTDPTKIADQQRSFYRTPTNCYAFETIAHHVTREPGWMFNSLADELFYYFIALDQTEEEVSALVEESDEVLFSRLSGTTSTSSRCPSSSSGSTTTMSATRLGPSRSATTRAGTGSCRWTTSTRPSRAWSPRARCSPGSAIADDAREGARQPAPKRPPAGTFSQVSMDTPEGVAVVDTP
jgi:hypothetical protein